MRIVTVVINSLVVQLLMINSLGNGIIFIKFSTLDKIIKLLYFKHKTMRNNITSVHCDLGFKKIYYEHFSNILRFSTFSFDKIKCLKFCSFYNI